MSEYCSIGKLVAAFGVQGELILQHDLGKKTALKGLQALFIENRKDELLPYFIESVRIKNEQELYVRLEGVASREATRPLLQKKVWLIEPDFRKYAASSSAISLLGFHIVQGKEDLGEILEVIEQPHQLLCRIDFQGREALIPLHEESLLSIDKKKKQVFVELPDGLLDIF